jgi:hypothetical protein
MSGAEGAELEEDGAAATSRPEVADSEEELKGNQRTRAGLKWQSWRRSSKGVKNEGHSAWRQRQNQRLTKEGVVRSSYPTISSLFK